MKRHAIFLIGVSVYFLFFISWLAIFRPWSAWIGGDYQSLNTLRFWLRDGFFTHFGLFLTQGYSPFIKALEQPDLWHHALSSIRLEGGIIAQSIYYNHYPTAYLIPLHWANLLIGGTRLLPLQIVQLSISFAGLGVMYAALVQVARKPLHAALAVIPYAFSWLFTDFAFSLNNLPLDDAFRWTFILLLLLEKKSVRYSRQLAGAAWIVLFCLAAVSLDSVLFCALWLVLTDLLYKPRWSLIGRWALFAGATIIPHVIQLGQSVAAWGWSSALSDQLFSFQSRSVESGTNTSFIIIKQRLYAWSLELYTVWFRYFEANYFTRYLALGLTLLLVGGAAYYWWKNRSEQLPTNISQAAALSVVAFLSALCFAGLVPVAGYMLYQGRQFIPCFAFLLVFALGLPSEKKLRLLKYCSVTILSLLTVSLMGTGIRTLIKRSPSVIFGRSSNEHTYTVIGNALKERVQDDRHIVFLIDADNTLTYFTDPKLKSFVYQISPGFGYRADMLILASQTAAAAKEDTERMRRYSKNEIIPIYIANNRQIVEDMANEDMKTCSNISQPSTSTFEVEGWYIRFGADCRQP